MKRSLWIFQRALSKHQTLQPLERWLDLQGAGLGKQTCSDLFIYLVRLLSLSLCVEARGQLCETDSFLHLYMGSQDWTQAALGQAFSSRPSVTPFGSWNGQFSVWKSGVPMHNKANRWQIHLQLGFIVAPWDEEKEEGAKIHFKKCKRLESGLSIYGQPMLLSRAQAQFLAPTLDSSQGL